MEYAAVWKNCLHTIQRNVNEQCFKTWFEPVKPVALQQGALTIQVPNKFFYEYLEEHFVALLSMTIKQELGERGRLEYQIVTRQPTEQNSSNRKYVTPNFSNLVAPEHRINAQTAPIQANNSRMATQRPQTQAGQYQAVGQKNEQPTSQNFLNTGAIMNPFTIPGIRKVKIDPQLNPNLTFDNYIEGDCNRMARSAGIAIAKNPGKSGFNPLFIFGDSGLGKTHLAQAIGNQIVATDPTKNVLYITVNHFVDHFVQAMKSNALDEFTSFYYMVDVLIVDDIQFLSHKLKIQEVFFHIFNQLHQSGRQLVFTADKAPKDLEGMEDRLISRFKWGLSADLHSPDLETKMAILGSKMNQEGLDLPTDITEFICHNIKSNIRELEGVMVSLIAQSSLNRREIDIELARDVIKNFVQNISREITVDFIRDLVADHYKVKPETLQGKTRKRSIVLARQLSMYLAKTLTSTSLKGIGENFGGRDHSTVIYSCKAVQDLMDTDIIFKDTVADLEKKIRLSLNGN